MALCASYFNNLARERGPYDSKWEAGPGRTTRTGVGLAARSWPPSACLYPSLALGSHRRAELASTAFSESTYLLARKLCFPWSSRRNDGSPLVPWNSAYLFKPPHIIPTFKGRGLGGCRVGSGIEREVPSVCTGAVRWCKVDISSRSSPRTKAVGAHGNC